MDPTESTHPPRQSAGDAAFPSINRAHARVFQPARTTLGLVVPIESYPAGPVPTLERHLERVELAERLGFAAVWLRDVPFHVPSFGDAGQLFDPFVYLGLLAGRTEEIALGVASVILPLRHPAHVAKAAATADVLSGGRVLLGIASGDRPAEYPAMAVPFEGRGARFRASYDYLRGVERRWPVFEGQFGSLDGQMDLLPAATGGRVPLLLTGGSQQTPSWVASHGDGWMVYPREPEHQAAALATLRARGVEAGLPDRPVMQPLYVDLVDPAPARPVPIHLGLRLGLAQLFELLTAYELAGVNHVALNLRFQSGDVEEVLQRIADELLPRFPSHTATP